MVEFPTCEYYNPITYVINNVINVVNPNVISPINHQMGDISIQSSIVIVKLVPHNVIYYLYVLTELVYQLTCQIGTKYQLINKQLYS